MKKYRPELFGWFWNIFKLVVIGSFFVMISFNLAGNDTTARLFVGLFALYLAFALCRVLWQPLSLELSGEGILKLNSLFWHYTVDANKFCTVYAINCSGRISTREDLVFITQHVLAEGIVMEIDGGGAVVIPCPIPNKDIQELLHIICESNRRIEIRGKELREMVREYRAE
ncbi:MAG: hypothetical protein WCJ56_11975 [bacterium]